MEEYTGNPQGFEPNNGGQVAVVEPTETPAAAATEERLAEKEIKETGAAEKNAVGAQPSDSVETERLAELERQRAINQAAKAARISGEKVAEERLKREYNERIIAQHIPDPYHEGKFFDSIEAFEKYGRQLRAESAKISPEEIERQDEDRRLASEKRAELAEAERLKKENEQRAGFVVRDALDFQAAFPKADAAKLEQDAEFIEFAGSRLYREPLADIYRGYLKFTGNVSRAAVQRAQSKQERSTGAGNGGGGDTLSPSQQSELERWNRENPELAMSAKEFLER